MADDTIPHRFLILLQQADQLEFQTRGLAPLLRQIRRFRPRNAIVEHHSLVEFLMKIQRSLSIGGLVTKGVIQSRDLGGFGSSSKTEQPRQNLNRVFCFQTQQKSHFCPYFFLLLLLLPSDPSRCFPFSLLHQHRSMDVVGPIRLEDGIKELPTLLQCNRFWPMMVSIIRSIDLIH